MKQWFNSLLAVTALGLVGQASATTTLVFGLAGTNRATGFANAANVATVGMRWGLIIDTAGDGFDNTFLNATYDSFVNSVSGFISASVSGISSGVTDDYFWTNASLPTTLADQGAAGVDPGGSGAIVSAASAPNGNDGIIPGVTTGDKFAIVWFDGTPAAGSNYGTFTDASFLLPSSGTTVNMNTPFLGNTSDPLKPANLQFTSGVPEPSRLMLLGLGGLGLVFRRRRC